MKNMNFYAYNNGALLKLTNHQSLLWQTKVLKNEEF